MAGLGIGDLDRTVGVSRLRTDISCSSNGEEFERLLGAGRWWLVHTRPRQEKALAADLETFGIRHFLPLVTVLRETGGRTTEVRLPLFPGYLFLCGGSEERLYTLRTNRAVGVITVVDQQRLRCDLRQIRRVVSSGRPVDVYPGIRRGRRCRVTHGILRGLEGTVLRRRNVFRVSISVDVLGQSAEVEIDTSLLEVIE